MEFYYDLYTDSADLCCVLDDEFLLGSRFEEDGKLWEIVNIDFTNMRLTIVEVQ